MLGWAVTFLIIALVAAVLGFGGIAAASTGIAKVLFFLFLVMCIIFFIFGWRGRGVPWSASRNQWVIVDCVVGLAISFGNALRVAPVGHPNRLGLQITKADESGYRRGRRFRLFFCVTRNAMREETRVSALRNFLMSASAESFSFFVFDTVQSEGTNKLKSRI